MERDRAGTPRRQPSRIAAPSLKLVDGPKFVDMLAKHEVVLQLGKFGELKRRDQE